LTNENLYAKREKIGYTTGYGFNFGWKGGEENKNKPEVIPKSSDINIDRKSLGNNF